MNLYTFEEFSNRVAELSNVRTRKEAYELTESEHIYINGQRKYSGYDSYKNLASYYYRKKRLR